MLACSSCQRLLVLLKRYGFKSPERKSIGQTSNSYDSKRIPFHAVSVSAPARDRCLGLIRGRYGHPPRTPRDCSVSWAGPRHYIAIITLHNERLTTFWILSDARTHAHSPHRHLMLDEWPCSYVCRFGF